MDTKSHIPQFSQAEWLDLTTVAREFPISKRTVWRWIAARRLHAFRPFKKILIRRADLVRMLEEHRIGA
jgi:excisionase family DNA binding protein